MLMKFDVMTLFPDMVRGVLSESIIGRAQNGGLIEVECHNIRDFSTDKHRKTDDTPYGGGVGMVMTCQPIYDCYESVVSKIPEGNSKRVIYMSPKGGIFSHQKAAELAKYDNLIFLCGHYEHRDVLLLDAGASHPRQSPRKTESGIKIAPGDIPLGLDYCFTSYRNS